MKKNEKRPHFLKLCNEHHILIHKEPKKFKYENFNLIKKKKLIEKQPTSSFFLFCYSNEIRIHTTFIHIFLSFLSLVNFPRTHTYTYVRMITRVVPVKNHLWMRAGKSSLTHFSRLSVKID